MEVRKYFWFCVCVSPKRENKEIEYFSICVLHQKLLQTAIANRGLYKPLYIVKREFKIPKQYIYIKSVLQY